MIRVASWPGRRGYGQRRLTESTSREVKGPWDTDVGDSLRSSPSAARAVPDNKENSFKQSKLSVSWTVSIQAKRNRTASPFSDVIFE